MKILNQGITAPQGFQAAGLFAGLKRKKKDMALIYSAVPCIAACAFTTNQVKAAPVLYNQKLYQQQTPIQAVIINSGNANACTGEAGYKNTETMAMLTAQALNLSADNVMVNSTGVIGVQLPMNVIGSGIQQLVPALDEGEQADADASQAILTTDTFTKTICVEIIINQKPVKIAAMAKGSGMINPNMATMLSYVTTDAAVEQKTFRAMLSDCILDSYNMLSVDGDTSTNDTVICLANGLAGNDPITATHPDYEAFKEAFYYVNQFMAKQIARDGEGATKLLCVKVLAADTKDHARKIALSVIQSSLVKTAIFGEDANWGRVLCAMGYAGVAFDPDKVILSFQSDRGEILLYQEGKPIDFNEEEALKILQAHDINILINMQNGTASAESFGCDLSYEYVKINGEYRS